MNTKGAKSFTILTGIGDSSSFKGIPTWKMTDVDQDKCYFGDYGHPSADVAAQVAAGLAAIAKLLKDHSADRETGARIAQSFKSKALLAFEYASDMYQDHQANATCSKSSALKNCVGSCLAGAVPVRIATQTASLEDRVRARATKLGEQENFGHDP
jgi:hypothetical protein